MDAVPTRYAGNGCDHHGERLGRVLLRLKVYGFRGASVRGQVRF
jgi:hypothetical protein